MIRDRQVSLHLHKGSTFSLIFFEHTATAHVHDVVDAAHSRLRAGNLHKEDRLLQSWGRRHQGSKTAATSWWHDLARAAMNGICMECYIRKVETNTSHVLFAK